MEIDKPTVESLVGTKINDISLYQRAFRHKSILKENPQLGRCFETLEFMGDSVLGFVITKFLFDRYEKEQEGFLTKARTKLVRGEMLAQIALKLGLDKWIQMDEKGMRNNWNKNPKILEDVFESLIGAIYLDLGLLHAKQFVLKIYENPQLVDMGCLQIDDNFKDKAMRFTQMHSLPLPDYRIFSHENGIFTIDMYINGHWMGRGTGKNKKLAEQRAAQYFVQNNPVE